MLWWRLITIRKNAAEHFYFALQIGCQPCSAVGGQSCGKQLLRGRTARGKPRVAIFQFCCPLSGLTVVFTDLFSFTAADSAAWAASCRLPPQRVHQLYPAQNAVFLTKSDDGLQNQIKLYTKVDIETVPLHWPPHNDIVDQPQSTWARRREVQPRDADFSAGFLLNCLAGIFHSGRFAVKQPRHPFFNYKWIHLAQRSIENCISKLNCQNKSKSF